MQYTQIHNTEHVERAKRERVKGLGAYHHMFSIVYLRVLHGVVSITIFSLFQNSCLILSACYCGASPVYCMEQFASLLSLASALTPLKVESNGNK